MGFYKQLAQTFYYIVKSLKAIGWKKVLVVIGIVVYFSFQFGFFNEVFAVETVQGSIETNSDIDIFQYMKEQTSNQQKRFLLSLAQMEKDNDYDMAIETIINTIKNNNSMYWWFAPQPFSSFIAPSSNFNNVNKIPIIFVDRSNLASNRFFGFYLQGSIYNSTSQFLLNCHSFTSNINCYVYDTSSHSFSVQTGSTAGIIPVGLEQYLIPELEEAFSNYILYGYFFRNGTNYNSTLNRIEQELEDANDNIQAVNTTIEDSYNDFTSDTYDSSDVDISTSDYQFVDTNGTDNFVSSFINSVGTLLDSTEREYTITIPFRQFSYTLSTKPIQDFYVTYPVLADLISTFWYFIIARYFIAFVLRILHWVQGMDEDGFSVSALAMVIGNYNIITRDIMFM